MKRRIRWISAVIVLCLLLVPVTAAEAAAAGEIRIDGYYDDWEGVPKTKVTYGNHNLNEFHQYGLLFDGEYLYGYVELGESYASNLPSNMYYISISNKVQAFNFWGCNPDGSINYSRSMRDLSEGTYTTGFGMFLNDYHPEFRGSAATPAITISSGSQNDRMEFAIAASTLELIYGLEEGEIKNGATIEMWCPNLGTDKAILRGTSSEPIIGVALCLVVVGGVWLYRKKGKRTA